MSGHGSKRAVCGRCARPPRACYCRSLPPTALRTAVAHVLVLQHEREQRRRQAISSVPVLRLVLERDVDVVRVSGDGECAVGAHARVDELLYWYEAEGSCGFDAALVLFPDAKAKLLGQELRDELGLRELRRESAAKTLEPTSKRVLVVVIDGTWAEAKKIAFRNREQWATAAESWRRRGKRFEYVCLGSEDGDAQATAEATGRSIYGDLRREPMDGCMSTLEAVGGALRVLEPPTTGERVQSALLSAFRGMVGVQSAFQQRGKAETLERFGGVSKEAAIQARTRCATPIQEAVGDKAASPYTCSTLRQREYVLFETRTDFRQRQELVQQGVPIACTYDQARDKCVELNVGRKRGQRLSFLPLDVFQQRQRQNQLEQSAHGGCD